MSLFVSLGLALVFLGFPFYWGAFEHGIAWVLVWAIGIALLVSARRWSHIDGATVSSFVLTLVVSVAVSATVFMTGRLLGR